MGSSKCESGGFLPTSSGTSTPWDTALTCTTASVWGLAGICSALILQDDEVMVTEGLPAKGLASGNIGSLICKGDAGKSTPAAGAAPAAGPAPSIRASQAEEKELEEKKGESEESDEDVHFGLLTKPLL
ncbi:60S acidic ribosomal protein P1-like [Mustela erminea]|uniref:60S acidic ribosomal protein P1-like n=1 Tax=Mustela erminea TaxID=36723 RepID=UPI001386BC61|nr:60S acidic ribosomal protein P1-like [Mustela erminea]